MVKNLPDHQTSPVTVFWLKLDQHYWFSALRTSNLPTVFSTQAYVRILLYFLIYIKISYLFLSFLIYLLFFVYCICRHLEYYYLTNFISCLRSNYKILTFLSEHVVAIFIRKDGLFCSDSSPWSTCFFISGGKLGLSKNFLFWVLGDDSEFWCLVLSRHVCIKSFHIWSCSASLALLLFITCSAKRWNYWPCRRWFCLNC